MQMTILLGIAVVGFLLWQIKKAVERPQKIKEAKEAGQRQQELERMREEVEKRDRNLLRRVEGLIEAEEMLIIDAWIDRQVAPSVHKLNMVIKEFKKFKPNKHTEDAVFGYLQACSDRIAQLKQQSAKKLCNELSDEIAKSDKADEYIEGRFNSLGEVLTWNAQYEATCALALVRGLTTDEILEQHRQADIVLRVHADLLDELKRSLPEGRATRW
jgi:hypothetical protein